jgi:hypothetical protein
MNGMLFAEFAIFVQFDPVRVIFFVFHRVIVALLAFLTRQSNLRAHNLSFLQFKKRLSAFYYSILVDSIIFNM